MPDTPDDMLDVLAPSPGEHDGAPAADRRAPSLRGRPWLAVHWRCCHVYSRLYRNPEATAYTGRCPACGRMARARISPDGTSHRFFEAY